MHQTECKVNTRHTPDDIAEGGEAQVDGRALFESVGLRPRRPLTLTASQVHQVDVGLLCDALFGEDLTGSHSNVTDKCPKRPEGSVLTEKRTV